MRFICCCVLLLILAALIAQDFPAPHNTEKEKGEPMPAAEAAAKFKVPPGFKVSVFASEPDVQNPIACCWDPQGRLWVAENYTYAGYPQRADLTLRDRILIFKDNGVGKKPDRKIFCDNLQSLTSIEVGLGGVWAMCPPQLLFIPMKDDKPSGPPQVMLDGFTVSNGAHHNFANGLKWGPDGWLYGRCGASCPGEIGPPGTPANERIPLRGGIWRYHPKRKVVEVLCHGTTNPWGHDWDERGECFFVNTVNGHLWHMIPGAHYVRPHTIDPNPYIYKFIDQHADHFHWDTSKDWSDSRDVNNKEHDKRGGGHAHSGAMIYLGNQWPKEYYGKLLTLNFHGRRVNVERLERHGSGFVGKHEPDMLIAADPFSRGIDLTYGPDGSVYILDWSDTGECHENTGVHRLSGRIYRVMYGEGRGDAPMPWSLDFPGDKRTKLGINFARTAGQRVLNQADIEANLVENIRKAFDTQPFDSIVGPHRNARYTAMRVDVLSLINQVEFSWSELVRLVAASTLQRLPIGDRVEVACKLVSIASDATDHNLPLLVWYGLIPIAKEHPDQLVKVAAVCQWPITNQCIARRLAEDIATRPGPANDLLRVVLERDDKFAAAIIAGLAEGLRGWQQAPKPVMWDQIVVRYPNLVGVRKLNVLFGDGRAIADVIAIALNDKVPREIRRSALTSLIAAKPPELRTVCEKLLTAQFLNSTAVKGLALFDDPAIPAAIIAHYPKFHQSERSAIIDVLVARPVFACALLDAVEHKIIAREDISAMQARQIINFNDSALTQRLGAVWGNVKETPADKKTLMIQLKARLTPDEIAKADLSNGRLVFKNICANCHKLYGDGGDIGPDLTGGQRDNLDYLLENIVDPSAVMSADFRVTKVTMTDGRLLIGIVKSRTDQAITLQMEKELVTIRKSNIEREELSDVSLMADGLLTPLKHEQVRDLFAYLLNRVQPPLPAGLAK